MPITTIDPLFLYAAIKYVLDRIQDMPDVRYYCGNGTEIFHRLTVAEAAFTGRPLVEVETARRVDLQPSYRRTQPRVLELQDRLDKAREACTCGGCS